MTKTMMIELYYEVARVGINSVYSGVGSVSSDDIDTAIENLREYFNGPRASEIGKYEVSGFIDRYISWASTHENNIENGIRWSSVESKTSRLFPGIYNLQSDIVGRI